ncbi:MAG: hypothetical protein RL021_969 [Bacteroidota bacterium]|jgi:nucleotide-binding universal stress UspA family protein
MNVRNIHPIRKLLVPSDFSSESANALLYAVSLAQKVGCRVTVYHAVHFPLVDPHGIATAMSQSDLEELARKRLMAFVEEVMASTGFRQIETAIGTGFAVDAIADFAKQQEVDLVVMGTHGAEGISAILGTNTAELMEKCGCPILSVPAAVRFSDPRRILFATDFADNDFQSIYLLSQYFKVFRTEIVVAHVQHQGDRKVEKGLMEWFKNQVQKNIPYDKISFELIEGPSVHSALNEFIEKSNYDLVVTSMRRRNFFDRLTGSSLTKKLVNHSSVPMLVFHAYTHSGTPVF